MPAHTPPAVALDYTLIFVVGMGVRGAALATVIAQVRCRVQPGCYIGPNLITACGCWARDGRNARSAGCAHQEAHTGNWAVRTKQSALWYLRNNQTGAHRYMNGGTHTCGAPRGALGYI